MEAASKNLMELRIRTADQDMIIWFEDYTGFEAQIYPEISTFSMQMIANGLPSEEKGGCQVPNRPESHLVKVQRFWLPRTRCASRGNLRFSQFETSPGLVKILAENPRIFRH